MLHQARDHPRHALSVGELPAVLDCHFDEEHAGKRSHGVHIGGNTNDAGRDVGICADEIDDRRRCCYRGQRAVEEVRWYGNISREAAEDMGVEV